MRGNSQEANDLALQLDLRLLEKLIKDHKDACSNDKTGIRRRVTTMLSVLDNMKGQVQKCLAVDDDRSKPALRRCSTDLMDNEKVRLMKELNASLVAKKNLEILYCGIAKEKQIIANELSKKVQEVDDMSELVSDLQAQNEKLLDRMQDCCFSKDHHGAGSIVRGVSNMAITERNRVLSEKLTRTNEGYQLIYRKFEEAQLENAMMRDAMRPKVVKALQKLRKLKELLSLGGEPSVKVQAEILILENMVACFQM